ncbi:MAG: hypothetical protein GXY83_08995 [Rhodopirellula sp.]|nr:hypothetical protein [Rhodopirellula sp.]
MKLHSPYLNPFQPFVERERESDDPAQAAKDRPRAAIENNLSRAVFSALANAERSSVPAGFLSILASGAANGSPALCERMKALAERLRHTDPNRVEFGFQTWPAAAMRKREGLKIILIGISSSYERNWTHDQREAPEHPCPDGWIHVPGEMLLVFECKNDEFPLDATQISAYAHHLCLLTENDHVPHAQPGQKLSCAEDAQTVQKACKDVVIDADWSIVVRALEYIERHEPIGSLSGWLCGKAAAYLNWNVYPPYLGIPTVLDWLNGPDTPDRRSHLRRLIEKVGEDLDNSAKEIQDAITFAKNKNDRRGLFRGGGAAVYVKLNHNGKLLQRNWLGTTVPAVLWFGFAEGETEQRVGLEYYLQANGSHARGKGKAAWNKASDRHTACIEPFEKKVAEWSRIAPASSRLIVSTIRFQGKCKIWHGGGVEAPDGPTSAKITPKDAVNFLRDRRNELWRFPRVGSGEECATVEEAAPKVRKPALSLLLPLESQALAACGADRAAFQKLLQNAVTDITTIENK